MPRVLTERDSEDDPRDPWRWRFQVLKRAGYSDELAWLLANEASVDLHQAVALLANGASVKQALRILL